jgi:hypothetical protein
MMQDVLDSIGEDMDDEEEQEKIYKEVLQNAGLKVDEILPSSNKTEVNKNEEEKVEEDSLDAMLKSLQK